MVTPAFESAAAYEKDYKIVPLGKEIYADSVTPISLLRKFASIGKDYYLLESIEGGERWGRYSFLGLDPLERIICKNGTVDIIKNGKKETFKTDKPLEILRKILKKYKSPRVPGMPPFTGGLVGYFAYNFVKYAEPVLKLKESGVNDFDLMLFDKVVAYDHLKQKIFVIANAKTCDLKNNYKKCEQEIDGIIDIILKNIEIKPQKADQSPKFTHNMTKDEYCRMVEKGKTYIKDGDIFQAVLSRKFEAHYNGSLINAYRVLRTTNPSPYMFYIKTGDVEIAGASPETLIKLNGDKLSTFPVAGTRPRGKNAEEDDALEKELLSDEKELAEHNMLVDLARNDIGRVSEYGSVKVEEYMLIHKYSKVMHITSIVTGKIKKDKDAFDAISAALPAGTLSGAPKIRACQIINEQEPSARGIYGGAVGYMDFSGNMDVCIAIRMAVKKDGLITVQAGGGIVADSIPENEYIESANKASSVIDAIERAAEVNE